MTPTTLDRRFLGIGWKFPLQVNAAGKIAQSRAEQRIEEGIYLVLSTAKGERAMLPEFGCGIHDLVYEPNNPRTVARAVQAVRDGLNRYEPRIDVLEVSADSSNQQENLLLIRVSYRIRANNAVGNLVYPFYIHEAG